MLPTLYVALFEFPPVFFCNILRRFCDHCKVQYERRVYGDETRLMRVNAEGEMMRTMSSGSKVCGPF